MKYKDCSRSRRCIKKRTPTESPRREGERAPPAVSVEQRDLPKFSKAGLTHTVGNKILYVTLCVTYSFQKNNHQ